MSTAGTGTGRRRPWWPLRSRPRWPTSWATLSSTGARTQATYGLIDARDNRDRQYGKDGWTLFNDQSGKPYLFRPSGEIAEPKGRREELYNAMLAFRQAHSQEESMPTEYARSWFKEPVADKAPLPVKVQHDGQETDIAIELNTMRSLHESYAEYSTGRCTDKLVAKKMLTQYEAGQKFSSMDGPKGRAAFKAVHSLAASMASSMRKGEPL